MRSLMLRAWLEPGGPPRLRARLVEIALGRRERSVLTTTSIDEGAALSGAGWKPCRPRMSAKTVTARRRLGNENLVRIWVDFLLTRRRL